MTTSAKQVSEGLMDLVDLAIEDWPIEVDDPELFRNGSTHGYDELGILTTDAGFVLRTADGSEYQVTIVKSN